MELNKGNWKCLNCSRFVDARTPCFVDNNDTDKRSFPDVRLEPSDECEHFINDNDDFIVDTSNENEIRVSYNALGKTFTGTVKRDILWDEATVKMAILKAKEQLLIEISRYEDQLNSDVENVADDTEDTNETVQTTKITSEELDIKMNAYIPETYIGSGSSRMDCYKQIAEIKGVSVEELAKITMENGKRFFNIK